MDRLFDARIHEIVLGAPEGHECRANFCDPQNEATLIRRGLLSGPPILPEHVYICKYGQIHECDENVCMADAPCLVSGASMGVLNQYESRPRGEEPKKKKRKYYDQLELLMDTLFYSPKRRNIVTNWNRQKSKQSKKYRDSYIKGCESRRKPVNVVHIGMLEEQYNLPCPIEASPERDMDRMDQYIRLTAELVDRIGAEGLCVESLCLSMLYKMRHGVTIHEEEMLPMDPWLLKVLPPINDLARLGIDKKKISRGSLVLMNLFSK